MFRVVLSSEAGLSSGVRSVRGGDEGEGDGEGV